MKRKRVIWLIFVVNILVSTTEYIIVDLGEINFTAAILCNKCNLPQSHFGDFAYSGAQS